MQRFDFDIFMFRQAADSAVRQSLIIFFKNGGTC